MASGFVFVYLAVAAIVAPVVWLVWWGLDSLSNSLSKPHARATIKVPTPPKPVFAAPHAIDLSLPVRRDRVTVFSAQGAEVSTCAGPDAGGRCSRPLGDGTVPCAGCLLALPRPIRGSLDWEIPAGYKACLLGSYGVLRQPAHVG
jgi:hypothetical protein